MRIFSLLAAIAVLGGGGAYLYEANRAGTDFGETIASLGAPLMQTASTEPEGGYATGEGQSEIKRIVIGLDLSASNPLISNSEYASKAAARVGQMIASLGFRSQVVVRTFGVYGGGENTFRFDGVVSSRYRPEDMAAEVEALIANTPELVRKGVWRSQKETNIVGWLENMAEVVDCASMPTTYVLLTDGLEDSEYARLKHANAVLPAPARAYFAGCSELLMLGVGRATGSPETTARLRETWRGWAGQAGFQSFAGLNDW